MLKKPLWISEELQRKFLTAKALLGVVNVEQVLLKLGIVEQLNKVIVNSLKKQNETTKQLIKNGKKSNKQEESVF